VQRYSVSGLVEEVDALLRSRFPAVVVEAEIAELTVPSSGHAFLRLADERASIAAVAWRTDWLALRHRPKLGERVLVSGRLAIYGQRGTFQIYVKDVRPVGEGALARELAARRARLEAEGLLDPRRKRPLPVHPRVVGVATSLRGAALQDFLRVSGERYPAARVLVAGCLVQGPQAPADILRAVELLLEDGRAEVIVVTRGGGSAEDLMAFQDEQLARILAHCPVPLVSAVGHEVDTTLCDLVADVVVPTPTAAAVRVLPDGPALVRRIDEAHLRLEESLQRTLSVRRRRVVELAGRLRHPTRRLAEVRRAAESGRERLQREIARALARRRERVVGLEQRLAALSPLAVLDRGYAVVTGPGGVLLDPAEAPAGTAIDVRLARGRLAARVVEPPEERSP
jgi:exodeoxyribonuclease VII large subunit